jgi:hypothetical protein
MDIQSPFFCLKAKRSALLGTTKKNTQKTYKSVCNPKNHQKKGMPVK